MILFLRTPLALAPSILLILIAGLLNLPIGNSQEELSNSNDTLVRIPATLSDSFELPDLGFSITFPRGWSGVDHGYIAMVSPDGINQYNGNFKRDKEKSVMVIEILNISDFQEHNFASKIQKECQIASEKLNDFNNIQSKEVIINCGTDGHQKIVNYIFASENKIIIVGLKGVGTLFDKNFDAFRNSIKTVVIKNPIDIRHVQNISSQT
jgi:hypothetical protein